MIKSAAISVLLLIILAASIAPSPSFTNSVKSLAPHPSLLSQLSLTSLRSYQIPNGNPMSQQPVMVFVQLNDISSNVDLFLSATVSTECTTSNTTLLTCPSAASVSAPLAVRFLPYLGARGWYFSVIPGLPAVTKTLSGRCVTRPLQTCYESVTLSSSVSYSISRDGDTIDSSQYQVDQGNYNSPSLPPIVGSFVASALTDPTIRNETYGLSPQGWVAGPSDKIQLISFAFSYSGISTLQSYYSVSNSSWEPMSQSADPIQSNLSQTVSEINSSIATLNAMTYPFGYSFPTPVNPILIDDSVIPNYQTPLGRYVMFKANSTSSDQKIGTSPEGFYYIVNKAAPTRVLVIDPHVELWLFARNAGALVDSATADADYALPSSLIASDTTSLMAAQLWNTFQEDQFHYWNIFGENYNITISFPDSSAASLLQSKSDGGFQPNIIYLSDLSLGYSGQSGSIGKQFFDWDLNDSQDSSGNSILSDLISYMERNQPTGLIASAGTLSDWEVWQSCSLSTATKIGSRGDVGESIANANPINETTLAAMMGMPLLPVVEFLRDAVATSLCSNPMTEPAGQGIGSTPLLVPIVPWNGALTKPNSQLILNVNPNITNGLPQNFSVSFPSVYQNYGYNATNTIGWQLSLPSVLASAAWQAANESRDQAGQFEQNIATLSSNITGTGITTFGLNYSLNSGLNDTFNSISEGGINSSFINVRMYIPSLQSYKEFPIPLGDLSKLESLLPVQIAALSPNYAAGIVTYDKYYTQTGYRSVYFSFPIESSNQNVSSTLFSNAINWSLQWEYKSPNILGGLQVSNSTMQTFRQAAANANQITNASVLLNEHGNTTVSFNSRSQSGRFSVIVAHTFSGNVSLKVSDGNVLSYSYLGNNVSEYQIESSSQPKVSIFLKSDAESSLNPAYVEVVSTSTSVSSSSSTATSSETVASSSSSPSTSTIAITSSLTTSSLSIQATQTTSIGSTTIYSSSIQTSSSSLSTESTSISTQSANTPQSASDGYAVFIIGSAAAVVVALGSAFALRRRKH